MKKKLFIALMAITTAFCCTFGLYACNEGNGKDGNEQSGGTGNTDVDSADNGQSPEQGGNTEKEPEKEPEKVEGSEGLSYTLSDDGTYYYLSGLGTCTDTEIVIANWYNDKPVTQIGKYTFLTLEEAEESENLSDNELLSLFIFMYNEEITSITIPEGITTIGVYPFYCCSVKSLTLPESVTTLCMNAFYSWDALTSLTIGSRVEVIGDQVFEGCESLTDINFKGSKEQWNSIDKKELWDYKNHTADYIIHCTDGDI